MTTPGEQVQVIALGEPGPQVVQIGTDSTPTPIYVPAPGVGGGPAVLDQLLDVDAPADVEGVLTREADGIVRAVSLPRSAYTQSVPQPTTFVQVQHGLPFPPAGVQCLETGGDEVEYASLTHPLPGVTEIGFGAPFTGMIHLS